MSVVSSGWTARKSRRSVEEPHVRADRSIGDALVETLLGSRVRAHLHAGEALDLEEELEELGRDRPAMRRVEVEGVRAHRERRRVRRRHHEYGPRLQHATRLTEDLDEL